MPACNTLHRKMIELICCSRRLFKVIKSHLNNRICQHCGVKTSTVTTSFYYVFNISLSCNNSIRSFIGNLWWFLFLGNYLKVIVFKKLRFQNILCPPQNEKPAFSNSSGLKSDFAGKAPFSVDVMLNRRNKAVCSKSSDVMLGSHATLPCDIPKNGCEGDKMRMRPKKLQIGELSEAAPSVSS